MTTQENGSGNTAIVAIVILVLVAVVGFFLFFTPGGNTGADGPDIKVQVESPDIDIEVPEAPALEAPESADTAPEGGQ